MPVLFRYALIFLTLILNVTGTAAGLEEFEHGALPLNGPQFDPLGGLADSVVSSEVYEHLIGRSPPPEPLARMQRSSSGTTEHRQIGTSPLVINNATLIREYDPAGILLEERTVDTRGNTQQRKAYIYDEDGRLQQVSNYQQQDSMESALILLYSKDLLGEVAVYEADGRPRWRRVYEYPEENVVSWSLLHADGRLQQAGELIYDSRNLLQEHRSLDENQILTERRLFEYDDEDHVVTISNFGPDNVRLEEYSFVYDEAGNLLRRVIEDKEGHPVSVTQYRYDYDKHGSWTRVDELLVEARRKRPFQVLRRVLTRDITYGSSS